MRSFKEQMEKDFNDAFFNPDEFAELHTIDGKEIPVVVDSETLIRLNMGKAVNSDGIFTDNIIIFVQKKYLDYEPVIGQVIDFDGVTYPVDNVLSDTGGYTVVLRGNEG